MNNNSWKKQFSIIYAGQAFSILGSSVVQFAIIWWLTIQTESAIVLTISTIISMLPNMILGPFAGVWVDRYNRKTVMMLSDGLIALSSLALGIIFLFTKAPPIYVIYIILFIRGIGSTFHTPAMQAAIPQFVPVEMLTKAGGWGNMISSLSNMVGPVLGAALFAFLPMYYIVLVDVLGAVFAIVSLLFVSIPNIERSSEKTHVISDLKEGLKELKSNKVMMAVLVPMIMVNILYMPLGSLFPLLIKSHFLGEALHSSLAEFSFALGLLASSLIIGIWGGMKKRFKMASLAISLLGLTSLIGGILPPTMTGFSLFVVTVFFMGTTGTFMNVPIMAYLQETTREDMMGKVFSIILTLMTLSMPVGLLIAGPISDKIGVHKWFLYSGIALVLTGIYARLKTKKFDSLTMLKTVEE